MTTADIETMSQSTLNLVTILKQQDGKDASRVMGGLIRFQKDLDSAISKVRGELRDARKAGPIKAGTQSVLPHAMRYGADDLVALSQTIFSNFDDLEDDDRLSAKAAADAMAWLNVAVQTSIAVRLLFQSALLFGRAPNGAVLASESAGTSA